MTGPVVARTRRELGCALAALPGPPVLVPTMGALHAGHAALLETAGPGCVLSVFVNPLQFGAGEDLARYPRTWEQDLALAGEHGVAVVFAPDAAEIYPQGPPQVRVQAGPAGEVLEGRSRPGHFDGVLTVVAKLFGLVRPRSAVFGEKDFQQLVLVRRMAADLDLGVRIEAVPTVRDPDGLALSSRNRYLGPAERELAAVLPRALATRDRSAAAELLGAAGCAVDYLTLVDPRTLEELSRPPGRLLAAVRIGGTRLIDNIAVPSPLAPDSAAG